ncbi:MAG: HmuY family protein [Rikenellaceae bacterium]|nr:HmuY family protein [Rikenellaceae bacterium]
MKKIFALMMSAGLLVSGCGKSDGGDEPFVGQTIEAGVDASQNGLWHYFSFKTGEFVGTGQESTADNIKWRDSKEWDMAVCRYNLRFNGGASTAVGSEGGVYICADGVGFENVKSAAGVDFELDRQMTVEGMGGSSTVVQSPATVVEFKRNEDGDMIMPPVYLKAPVYVVRTADGNSYYKVEFTQYKDADGVSGKVEFRYAEVER